MSGLSKQTSKAETVNSKYEGEVQRLLSTRTFIYTAYGVLDSIYMDPRNNNRSLNEPAALSFFNRVLPQDENDKGGVLHMSTSAQ
jgi:hypothetical protein